MIGVAILGLGVVGSGVYDTLKLNHVKVASRSMDEVEVKYILDLRDFAGEEFAGMVTHDFSVIENDPEVQVVVETMGGAGAAYDYTKRALLAGKHVVTSNKELVAKHGAELMLIADEQHVNYMFEASVGGGAPILRPLIQCMSANVIEEIYGILNGTTNFALGEMLGNNLTLDEAIKEAQRLGYAEKDPTADVEGFDPARKICILANIANGKDVGVENVRCEGISRIDLRDTVFADRLGYVIKLLGRYVRLSDTEVCAYVAPHLVPRTSVLASVNGVVGGVMIRGNVVGEVDVIGAGAGKMPTASAVVADVIDCARHKDKAKNAPLWSADRVKNLPPSALDGRMYVRADGAIEAAKRIFGGVMFAPGGGVTFITPHLTAAELEEKLDAFGRETTIRAAIRVIESGVER